MATATRSCYEVLGIAQGATPNEVKTAYAAILREIRARIGAGSGDPDLLVEARAAYTTLSNASWRAAHDAALAREARDIADVPVEIVARAAPASPPKQPSFFARALRRK